MLFHENGIDSFVPVTICFRPFINNPLFFIKYEINYKCSGYCQYKNGGLKILQTPPYTDITENNLENRYNKTLNDILVNYIKIKVNYAFKNIVFWTKTIF